MGYRCTALERERWGGVVYKVITHTHIGLKSTKSDFQTSQLVVEFGHVI